MEVPHSLRPRCCPWYVSHLQLLEEVTLSPLLWQLLWAIPLNVSNLNEVIMFILNSIAWHEGIH